MPRQPDPNAPLCPVCGARMRKNRDAWTCRTAHGLKPGARSIGDAPMTAAERKRRQRAAEKLAS